MKAQVYITPKAGILDPEGSTVGQALKNLGIGGVSDVRMGKYIEMTLPGVPRKQAEKITTEACDRLLVNPNIETYRFDILEDS